MLDRDGSLFNIDTTKISKSKYDDAVSNGRELMLHTAVFIGFNGLNGKYFGNKMNCSIVSKRQAPGPVHSIFKVLQKLS